VRKVSRFGLIILASLAFSSTVIPVFAQSPLDGAWEITKRVGNGETAPPVQASLYIFHQGFYSIFVDRSENPREPLAEGENRSNISLEKLQAMVLPLTANSGRYAIDGSTVTLTPTVAINPGLSDGASFSYEFHVSGNELTFNRPGTEFFTTLRRLR